ncbi:MAG TPA: cupin domain-containing protein [Puia sp.]|nr:cupin domain-containing protein [Puia sp.]
MNTIVSREAPKSHYRWGKDCEGWNLFDDASLAVKQERMPPQASEKRHLHHHSQQFFFILQGRATFEIEGERIEAGPYQGIHIPAGKRHRILNEGDKDLEFILASQPSTANDRVNVDP